MKIPVFHVLTNTYYFLSFFLKDDSHPCGYLLMLSSDWYLTASLVCVSLVTKDAEHLLMCLLVIRVLFLETCLSPLPSFKLGCFYLQSYDFFCVLWILDPYQIHILQIFSQILWMVIVMDHLQL